MIPLIRNNTSRVIVGLLCVLFLVLIRTFEESLFYDPFLVHFKGDFQHLPLPVCNRWQLLFSLFVRYFANSLFSLLIIYLFTKNADAVKFALILYLIFFVLLMIVFFIMLSSGGYEGNIALFYVRRFLIQPLFLLLFIPAFFYQRIKK